MEKLIINNSFKNFQNYGGYRYWPVVVRVDLMPFLKSGVTLAIFQSFGYIPVRIDFENIEVREGATILAAIFNNLLGILSRPMAFFSSIFDKTLETISTLGICRENE